MHVRRVLRVLMFAAAAGLVALAASCSTSPVAPSPNLRGGVVATFEVGAERFRVFVTNPAAIEQLVALQRGLGLGSIPNGRVRRGPGAGGHNAPFSWHLDPVDIAMAELTIELCDGSPAFVESHVGEYVDVIGRYCPWGARLVSLSDFR